MKKLILLGAIAAVGWRRLPSILRQPGRTGVVERGHARPRSALAALDGDVAQLVEHRLCKAGLGFKSPSPRERYRAPLGAGGRTRVLGNPGVLRGIQLMRDAFGLPADWLDALPFDSWVIPGILLMALVGVPAFGLLGMHVAGTVWPTG